MTRAAVVIALACLLGCGETSHLVPWDVGVPCDAGDEAFVRRALPLLWGRQPESIREVEHLVELIGQSDRATLVRGMMATPEFNHRMQRLIRDTYGFTRSDAYSDCEGIPKRPEIEPALAEWIRDHAADGEPYVHEWNASDLSRAVVALDDISPWLRFALYGTMGNVVIELENIEAERAIRQQHFDFFQDEYLNRRLPCLGCHNSLFSVTGSQEPSQDRTWEVPGLFEHALYGDSTGRSEAELSVFFRVTGVLSLQPQSIEPPWWERADGVRPWGVTQECGAFVGRDDLEPDTLGFDGYFIDPAVDPPSIWDIEERLANGLEQLRAGGLSVATDGTVAGEQSLAYLASMRFVEHIWADLEGRPLTIATGFARNQQQRDQLVRLVSAFIDGGFSLRQVVLTAMLEPTFNEAPAGACLQANPYSLYPIFDPWVIDETTPERRGNTIGDRIIRRPPWVLTGAATHALGWTPISEFEDAEEEEGGTRSAETLFLQAIGVPMDPRFPNRQSSLGERLAWEEAFGACVDPKSVFQEIDDAIIIEVVADPSGQPQPDDRQPDEGERGHDEEHPPFVAGPDWIDGLVDAAGPEHTLEHAVLALKDRLITDPDLSDPNERALMQSLLGLPLSHAVTSDPEAARSALRRVCGGLLMSPWFLLDGLAGPGRLGAALPLAAPGSSRAELCNALSERLFDGTGTQCDPTGQLVLSGGAIEAP